MTKCFRCGAVYDPEVKFTFGYRDRDSTTTDGGFVASGAVRPGDCPICNDAPLLAPLDEREARTM